MSTSHLSISSCPILGKLEISFEHDGTSVKYSIDDADMAVIEPHACISFLCHSQVRLREQSFVQLIQILV